LRDMSTRIDIIYHFDGTILMSLPPYSGLPTLICTNPANHSNILPEDSTDLPVRQIRHVAPTIGRLSNRAWSDKIR
jgi:hypothetical protein